MADAHLVAPHESRERFRIQSISQAQPSPWVSTHDQRSALAMLGRRIDVAGSSATRAIVGIDLDLTSLLAPRKSREVLATLAAKAAALAAELSEAPAGHADLLVAALRDCWQGSDAALLPGYTTTAIEGYSVYLVATLEQRVGLELAGPVRDKAEAWINRQVYGVLRHGYWARDLLEDEVTPGFVESIGRLAAKGGEVVFISNRAPAAREHSLAKLRGFVEQAGAGGLFAFFGPGGSTFDASSKSKAVGLIEQGVPPGVYLGEVLEGETHYPIASSDWHGPSVLVAMIDDRSGNRREVVEAAAKSNAFWAAAGEGVVADVAVAAQGFSCEIAIVDASWKICSFDSAGVEQRS